MKPVHRKHSISWPQPSLEAILLRNAGAILLRNAGTIAEVTEIWSKWRRQKLPLYLFLALCFNLLLAPVVYAAADGGFSRTQSWALGLLGLATVGLSIYLFFVMFVPEKY